jgi:hypothetical protein
MTDVASPHVPWMLWWVDRLRCVSLARSMQERCPLSITLTLDKEKASTLLAVQFACCWVKSPWALLSRKQLDCCGRVRGVL